MNAERERSSRVESLQEPTGSVRVVIDTDAANEIDDQFALAWALLSQDTLEIEGMYATPFAFTHMRPGLEEAFEILSRGDPLPPRLERYRGRIAGLVAAGRRPTNADFPSPEHGMELSFEEIFRVHSKMNMQPSRVLRGSKEYLRSVDEPVRSDAAEHLIETAMKAEERPLYVVAIGCATNVASAILMEPRILDRIVVVWTSAYPSFTPLPNTSFNLEQDVIASQILFDSRVPLVYLPGYYVGAQLPMSLADVEKHVRSLGEIGEYLHHLFTNNPAHARRGVTDIEERTWVIWDLINIAWLLDPRWVPSVLHPTPILGNDLMWHPRPDAHLMREAIGVDRDAIFRDFYSKLRAHASSQVRA